MTNRDYKKNWITGSINTNGGKVIEEDFGKILAKFRLIHYGDLFFKVICPICGEPVYPDESINIDANGDFIHAPNAECQRCGLVEMPFAGRREKK